MLFFFSDTSSVPLNRHGDENPLSFEMEGVQDFFRIYRTGGLRNGLKRFRTDLYVHWQHFQPPSKVL